MSGAILNSYTWTVPSVGMVIELLACQVALYTDSYNLTHEIVSYIIICIKQLMLHVLQQLQYVHSLVIVLHKLC